MENCTSRAPRGPGRGMRNPGLDLLQVLRRLAHVAGVADLRRRSGRHGCGQFLVAARAAVEGGGSLIKCKLAIGWLVVLLAIPSSPQENLRSNLISANVRGLRRLTWRRPELQAVDAGLQSCPTLQPL